MPAPRKIEVIEQPEANEQLADPKPSEQPIGKFYKVTAREYMVTFPPFTLMLYPGTSAVITQEQHDLIHPVNLAMLTVEEISETQFVELFAKQGKIGWV